MQAATLVHQAVQGLRELCEMQGGALCSRSCWQVRRPASWRHRQATSCAGAAVVTGRWVHAAATAVGFDTDAIFITTVLTATATGAKRRRLSHVQAAARLSSCKLNWTEHLYQKKCRTLGFARVCRGQSGSLKRVQPRPRVAHTFSNGRKPATTAGSAARVQEFIADRQALL